MKQAHLNAARHQEAVSAAAAQTILDQQNFRQSHLAAGMAGGDAFFHGTGGADPRLDYFLMQQRTQQERMNELAMLEQQRLASLDPEVQMRLLRGGGAGFGGFSGMNPNMMGQQMSFNQRFDPSASAMMTNERLMSMRNAAAQQTWMQQSQISQHSQAASGTEPETVARGPTAGEAEADGAAGSPEPASQQREQERADGGAPP